MQSLLFVVFIAIASLQGTFGAPSCSKDLSSCVSKCRAKFNNPMVNNTSGQPSYSPKPSSAIPSSTSVAKANLEGNPTSTPIAQPSSTPSAVSSPVPASSTAGSVSSADIEAYLSAHNTVRGKYGAAPLTWSNSLSSKAQEWANNCKFMHSGGTLGPFGENLAAGTGDGYTIASAVKSWTDEASSYNAQNPVASHFTQVVWKATTQVGCAVQDCSGIFSSSYGLAHFHVCEYSPAGNVEGEFAQNVGSS